MKGLFDNLKDTLGSLTQNNNNQQNTNNNLGSLLGVGAVGGLLGALFGGSKTVRNIAKNAAFVGGGALAASLAYKYLQKWQETANDKKDNQASQDNSQNEVITNNDAQALLLLQAMIFSARSDGHIDDNERALIDKCSQQFASIAVQSEIQKFMNCPLDPKVIASQVQNHEQALDIYTLSSAIIICDNFMEESYLNGLAQALNLSYEEKKSLDAKASDLRNNLQN